DRGKATVKVRVALREKNPRIVPDMGINVSFHEQAAPQAEQQAAPRGVRVAAAAVAARDGRDVALVLDEDGERVQQRELEVGRRLGDARQVLSGLAAGETVVLDPPKDLEDGSRVTPAGN